MKKLPSSWLLKNDPSCRPVRCRAAQPIRVAFFQRRPLPNAHFSIERVFEDVRSHLPQDIEPTKVEARCFSTGIRRRILSMLIAVTQQEDVNHVTGDVTFLAIPMKRSRTVLTIHDLIRLTQLTGVRRSVFEFFWFTLPIRRAGFITFVSEATRADVEDQFELGGKELVTIHNPVSDMFVETDYIFNSARPRLLQIGTTENKNIVTLAKALQGIPCELRIIGVVDEVQHQALTEYGVEYTSVRNLTSDDMVVEYRTCDMVTFVSTHEGFGLPILEGQATGRPVLTSAISPMAEVAGAGACLVDPYDAEDIKRGILRMLSDHEYRQALLQNGFHNVRRFSAASIAEEYARLYRRIHAENSRSR